MVLRVGIYLFDEVEVLDFAGPFEVFSTASRLYERAGAEPVFAVHLLGPDLLPVSARGGMRVLPQYAFADAPPLDVLIIPGGVVTAELQRPGLASWLQTQVAQLQVLASICTGAFVLEQAGLLNGREVITHWEDLDDLRTASQASGSMLKVLSQQRWVEAAPLQTCRLFTSAGISAGIDLSLHLVAELASPELARRTARQMDYDWRAANGSLLQAAGGKRG
jgi:transcriptional regulator GlxA family with amidase domain